MENKNEKYNGWTNYPTWRIKLELFDDTSMYDKEVTAEQIKEETNEMLGLEVEERNLIVDYAQAFLNDVNWYEIAESINEDLREIKKENKCILCGEDYGKFGHNPQPLSDGRCCDKCNCEKVIPTRLKELEEKQNGKL